MFQLDCIKKVATLISDDRIRSAQTQPLSYCRSPRRSRDHSSIFALKTLKHSNSTHLMPIAKTMRSHPFNYLFTYLITHARAPIFLPNPSGIAALVRIHLSFYLTLRTLKILKKRKTVNGAPHSEIFMSVWA
jgi:hypothetical protein